MCNFLNELGININTVPVLDVLSRNTNKVIKKRSFSNNSKIVKNLGYLYKQYHLNKIATVIKHIPGHGCAKIDSHLKTPIVNLNLSKF